MRYYFHVRHHDLVHEDLVGAELESMDVVRREAFDGARDIIADRVKGNNPVQVDTIFEVRDEDGEIVHMLPFAAVLLSFLTTNVRDVMATTGVRLMPPQGSSGRNH